MLADNYFQLEGRVAIVTGASSGLGQQFADVLGRAGCRVALLARRAERLQELADAMQEAGSEALAVPVDVTDAAATTAALVRINEHFGPASILINNAGNGNTQRFIDESDEEADAVMDLNLRAAWRLSRVVSQQMIDAGNGGAIINIASILGLRVLPQTGSYAVSKAALIQLTRVMALELARYDIRVNAIAPGYVMSELTHDFLNSDGYQQVLQRVPQRRYATPDELDGLLLLLASERSSYMTGSVIPIDGGHMLASI